MTKQTADVQIDWNAILVEAINAPGSLGKTYCRFYNYSFLNQIRLLMQGVNEPVATYNRWAELGFQVRKGTKAKVVLAPKMISKVVERNGQPVIENGKPKKRQILIGFKEIRTVFGFSDTDGDELPPIELPAWQIDRALAGLGVERERFAHTDGNCQGYSYEKDGRKIIAINPAAAYPGKTLLHELAHLVLGHCKARQEGEAEHRGVTEFEAEATAYLVAKELEMPEGMWDPAESRAYIQGYLGSHPEGDAVVTDKHIGRIFGAVQKVLTAGRAAAEAAESAA